MARPPKARAKAIAAKADEAKARLIALGGLGLLGAIGILLSGILGGRLLGP